MRTRGEEEEGESMSTSTEFPGLSQIGQIAINVQEVERATAFYRDTLGMRFLFTAPPSLAFFDCGGVRLMLTTAPADRPDLDHKASILFYRVADIEAAHAALTARGVRFELGPHLVARMPDHELWLADFYDSEDNLLALMAEKRPADSAWDRPEQAKEWSGAEPAGER
jgi:methylmalonyl-CoA/ethylmalonyl-CoA epimerase